MRPVQVMAHRHGDVAARHARFRSSRHVLFGAVARRQAAADLPVVVDGPGWVFPPRTTLRTARNCSGLVPWAPADGLPMAVEHPDLPPAGLQFHPDSHGTPRGREVVRALFDAVAGNGT